jgi:hypothetical protein
MKRPGQSGSAVKLYSSMTQETESSTDSLRRYVPLLAWIIAISLIILIPFKIISLGYMPYDDALRHSAKAVSGKPWSEILVLGDNYKVDHNFGWEFFLRQVHLLMDVDADWLVVFSIVFLFLVISSSGFFWLQRPEAWIGSLLLVGLVAAPQRMLYGRPYIVSMSVLISILLLWNKSGARQPGWRIMVAITAMVAVAVFLHGTWYLWALPVLAFVLAGQFRWGFVLAAGSAAGALTAAVLVGHPVVYLTEAVKIAFSAVPGGFQVESRPAPLNLFVILLLVALVVVRILTRPESRRIWQSPAFWLVVLCLLLGLKVGRFWTDWGLPALLVLLATNLELLLQKGIPVNSVNRLVVTLLLAMAAYFAFTNDHGRRWTKNLLSEKQYLVQGDPELEGWLPDKGGIFYTADMSLFYKTFLKNPNAEWRYIVGFEPALMPADDARTFHQILTTYEWRDYTPWVKKMKPADRLFIPGGVKDQPEIPELEWKYLGPPRLWTGRLPARDKTPQQTTALQMSGS